MDTPALKQAIKDAITEALHENRHELAEPGNRAALATMITDILEDIGLGIAMDAAKDEEPVPYEQAKAVLRGEA